MQRGHLGVLFVQTDRKALFEFLHGFDKHGGDALDSRRQGSTVQKTSQLQFAYRPRDYRAMREMGASWKTITEDRPEPKLGSDNHGKLGTHGIG